MAPRMAASAVRIRSNLSSQVEPPVGIEPTTYSLRVTRSADWAKACCSAALVLGILASRLVPGSAIV